MSRLSVAQQQVVEIVKALATDARIVAMDEPTAALADHEVGLLFDLVRRLTWLGHDVAVADALADPAEIERDHGLKVMAAVGGRYDLVVGAVAHNEYRQLTNAELESLVAPGGMLADLKGIWRDRELNAAVSRWTL